jgi:hypothetical protein
MKTTIGISFTSKRLASGNLQIKFHVQGAKKVRYGYLLADGESTEEDIIEEIRRRLKMMETSQMDLLRFSFKQRWQDDHQFYLYSA